MASFIIPLGGAADRHRRNQTILGGAITAVVVVILSLRHGSAIDSCSAASPSPMMLASVNDYLIDRSAIEAAEVAKAWQYGSLNTISWPPIFL